ncbi:hypothetical protein WDW86_14460 [Bdellovibrionota bacterium FG-2]
MGKIRRGNYVFVSWIGDHSNHVHVFREGKLMVKWNLDHDCEAPGSKAASRKIKELISELKAEGKFQYENKKSRL